MPEIKDPIALSDTKKQQNISDVSPSRKQNVQTAQNIWNSGKKNDTSKNIFSQGEGNSKKSFNIFASKSTQQTQKNGGEKGSTSVNIFQNKGLTSVNLFQAKKYQPTNTTNIFNSSSKPLIRPLNKDFSQDDDSQSKSSYSLQSSAIGKAQKQFLTSPDKSKMVMKFDYDNKWQVIKSFKLNKFRNGSNPSKQLVELSLETYKQDQSKLVHFVVRSRQTRLCLFQGVGLKNLSNKIDNFMNKEQNLKVTVLKEQRLKSTDEHSNQSEKKKWVKQEIKMQFETVSDAEEFKRIIKDLIKDE